jgi:hypothetical protein
MNYFSLCFLLAIFLIISKKLYLCSLKIIINEIFIYDIVKNRGAFGHKDILYIAVRYIILAMKIPHFDLAKGCCTKNKLVRACKTREFNLLGTTGCGKPS